MFIRPLVDSSAFQGAEKPPILQSVVREARTLASEAEQARVTSGAEPDLRAARIVSLLDGRGLYTSVLEDTARIVSLTNAAATAAATGDQRLSDMLAGGPAIELVAMDTTFVPASGGMAAADTGMGSDPYGGDPRSGLVNPGGMATPAPAQTAPPSVRGKAHVRVTSTYRVAAPNLERFMLEVVEPVLKDQVAGDRGPYTIVFGQVPWSAGMNTDPSGMGGMGNPGGRNPTYQVPARLSAARRHRRRPQAAGPAPGAAQRAARVADRDDHLVRRAQPEHRRR